MKIQHLCIILSVALIIFSLSAVSATNETVTNDVNSSNSIVSGGDNASHMSQCDNVSYSASIVNYGYANSSESNSINFPNLELSLKSDENNTANPYVDISISYNDYSSNINNKNYFFTLNQNYKDNPIHNSNDKKIIDIYSMIKNNNLVLNIQFLNMTNQSVEVYSSDNLLNNFLKMFISFFNSLFN